MPFTTKRTVTTITVGGRDIHFAGRVTPELLAQLLTLEPVSYEYASAKAGDYSKIYLPSRISVAVEHVSPFFEGTLDEYRAQLEATDPQPSELAEAAE